MWRSVVATSGRPPSVVGLEWLLVGKPTKSPIPLVCARVSTDRSPRTEGHGSHADVQTVISRLNAKATCDVPYRSTVAGWATRYGKR